MRAMTKLLAAALTLALAACGGKGGEQGTSHEDPNAPPHIDAFRIGRSVGSGGVVNSETDHFKKGEPVYASFLVKKAPKDVKIKVVWLRLPDKAALGED